MNILCISLVILLFLGQTCSNAGPGRGMINNQLMDMLSDITLLLELDAFQSHVICT
jgi:hypothetical protein